MNDKQILQWAFDALSDGYEGGRLNDVLTVLRDRLTQPEPWVKTYSGGKPNYTEPKEWVWLTDEEIKACAKGGRSIGISFHDAIQKAEAKLKEKNT